MHALKFSLSVLLLLVWCCVPVQYADHQQNGAYPRLETTDRTYYDYIKTVQLYAPEGPMPLPVLNPAVAELNNQQLILEFDVLQSDRDALSVRIVHCNHNWTPSALSNLDFLEAYNAFPINDFVYSIDTSIPYIHYRTVLPPVKLPGNYVAVVFRNQNPDDVLLTRRFMVYESRVHFRRQENLLGPGTAAELNQQLNFIINYARTEIINPQESIHLTIRQNQRWDNIAQGLKPTFIREHLREMEFRQFTADNLYPSGNEFRFFDLRSLINPGVNVSHVDRNRQPWQVYLATDQSRAGQRYARYPDLNGQYVIANLDNPQPQSAQYVNVRFTLRSPQLPGEVYLSGSFTDWRLAEPYRLVYEEAANQYYLDVLLKQGWYNYQYVVRGEGISPNLLEGNHFETENMYEILVYYRPFQPPADLLIGYYRLHMNHPDR